MIFCKARSLLEQKKRIYFAMVHFIKKALSTKKAGEVFEILNAFF